MPPCVALGTQGGPVRSTQIATLDSGHEERNMRWELSKREYTVDIGVLSDDDMAAVVEFFEARGGMAHGFRFQDPADFKSCRPSKAITPLDQPLGTGDGSTNQFQLVKIYRSGLDEYRRPITKPVGQSLRVAVDGVEIVSGVVCDITTGTVIITPPPAPGAAISCGFWFDVPVRWAQDSFRPEHVTRRHQRSGSFKLIEIRDIDTTDPAYVTAANAVPSMVNVWTPLMDKLGELA
ncbi:MAG: DUF2460 domain-containing protein [Neomegalonema sp.]|nr:DUF2460 domain-containing protein [Neomegalonema sp.]